MEDFINEMLHWPEYKYSLVARAVNSVVSNSHGSFGLGWPRVQISPYHSLINKSTILPPVASGKSVTLLK